MPGRVRGRRVVGPSQSALGPRPLGPIPLPCEDGSCLYLSCRVLIWRCDWVCGAREANQYVSLAICANACLEVKASDLDLGSKTLALSCGNGVCIEAHHIVSCLGASCLLRYPWQGSMAHLRYDHRQRHQSPLLAVYVWFVQDETMTRIGGRAPPGALGASAMIRRWAWSHRQISRCNLVLPAMCN